MNLFKLYHSVDCLSIACNTDIKRRLLALDCKIANSQNYFLRKDCYNSLWNDTFLTYVNELIFYSDIIIIVLR